MSVTEFFYCAYFYSVLPFSPYELNLIPRILLMRLFSLNAFRDEFLFSQTLKIRRLLLMRLFSLSSFGDEFLLSQNTENPAPPFAHIFIKRCLPMRIFHSVHSPIALNDLRIWQKKSTILTTRGVDFKGTVS